MNAHLRTIVSTIIIVSAIASTGVYAAQGDDVKKALCFKMHAKLMDKPALMNLNDCWRAHAYLMDR
jgi:hypothetical protein